MSSKRPNSRRTDQGDSSRAVATTDQQQGAVVQGTPREMRGAIDAAFAGHRQQELVEALSGRYPVDYFIGVAATQFTRSPGLWGASLLSVHRAILEAAEIGLPFLAGRAYLVPFRNHGVLEAQLIIGYQGLVDLIADGGHVVFVEAATVRRRDHFKYQRGTSGYLDHVPWEPTPADHEADGADSGAYTHAWAMAKFRGEDRPKFDVMTYAELEAVRRRAPSAKAASSPWVSDWSEMAKKTVLRRLAKTLPLGLSVMKALEAEDATDRRLEQSMSRDTQSRTAAGLRTAIQSRVGGPAAAAADAAVDDQQPPPPDDSQAPAQAGPRQTAATAQKGDSAATDVAQPVAGQDGPPAAAQQDEAPVQQTMDTADTPQPTCDAKAKAGGKVVSCVEQPGHAGDHTDGHHDWPRK